MGIERGDAGRRTATPPDPDPEEVVRMFQEPLIRAEAEYRMARAAGRRRRRRFGDDQPVVGASVRRTTTLDRLVPPATAPKAPSTIDAGAEDRQRVHVAA